MGVSLWLEADDGESYNGHRRSDFKAFQFYHSWYRHNDNLYHRTRGSDKQEPRNVFQLLENELGVDLSALKLYADRSADEGWGEDYLRANPEQVILMEQARVRNAAAWQPPENIAQPLRALLQALNDQPDVFATFEPATDHHYINYFLTGSFQRDVEDLLKSCERAEAAGVKTVRLMIG